MNNTDIKNYNNILTNIKIDYSNNIWLGITNNNLNYLNDNLSILERLQKELNERKYIKK